MTVLLRGTTATLPSGWDFGPSGAEERPPYPYEATRVDSSVSLDFEGIALVFGGLLSFGLGVYRVVADRESHWFDAIRVFPIPWRQVTAARLITSAVVIGLVLTIWLATVAIAASMVDPDSANELRRALLLLAVPTFLYLNLLNAVGMAAALWSRSSLRAAVTGMTLWLVIAFILPQALAVISRMLSQPITRHSMEQNRRDAHADSVRRFEDAIGRTIAEHVPDRQMRQELVGVDAPAVVHLELNKAWLAGMADARSVAASFESNWRDYRQNRLRLQNVSVALSPGTALTVSLSDLARVGGATEAAWELAVQSHYELLRATVFDDRPLLTCMVPSGNSFSPFALVRHPPRRYSMLPAFQEPVTSNHPTWSAAGKSLAWLSLHTVAAMAFAFVSGLRALRHGMSGA
jgi:hypothetical protein